MAGERLGKAYEAFLFVAANTAGNGRHTVAWNPQAAALMVQPDLVVGDLAAPDAVVMVTRSAARRNWHNKFWRTVGEVVDVRGVFPASRVVNIVLGTEIKEELSAALALIVDENVFPDRDTREVVEEWLARVAVTTVGDREDLAETIRASLPSAPKAVRDFATMAGSAIMSTRRGPSSTWKQASTWLSARARGKQAVADWRKPASLRRGLSKLMVAGEPAVVLGGIDARLGASSDVGKVLADFGWASKGITGWRVTDPEISSVLKAYPRDVLTEVLRDCSSDELRAMCADLSSVLWLREIQTFLRLPSSRLSDPMWVSARIAQCRKDPTLDGQVSHVPIGLKGSWLFRALVALVKFAMHRKQGFGYEQLIGDVRSLAAEDRRLLVAAGADVEALRAAGATDSLRRKLVDWVSGLAECVLADWQVLLVGIVIARRIEAIGPKRIEAAIDELPAFMRRSTYEDRVAPYRFFEPVPSLLRLLLRRANVNHEVVLRYPTLVSESSPSARAPGTTPVVVIGTTLVHWKSAHGSHTSDKTKELCGRGFALRHRLSKAGAIEHVEEISRLALILDGDFGTDDVSHLRRSGWDAVTPSQDIPALVAWLGNWNGRRRQSAGPH